MSATVLVVDPGEGFLLKTREILASAGFDMLSAHDAIEARELLVRKRPTVMLLAARLPGDNAFELARFAKATDPALPVVLLYSREERGATTTVHIDVEVDNYVVRPLKKGELLSCVRDMLRIRRLQEEAARYRAEIDQLRHQSDAEHEGDPLRSFEVFKKLLFVEVKRARRHNLPLSALLISIDGVDALTTAHGAELAGSLREAVGKAIRRSVRDTDLPVQLHVGNLLLLMPHTDEKGAQALAQRIQQRIRRSAYKHSGRAIRPTLSIGGMACEPGAAASFSAMISAATRALREAQKGGGDRSVIARGQSARPDKPPRSKG